MRSIRQVLNDLLNGSISIETAEAHLKNQSLVHVESFAQFDIDRDKRSGIPEAIYAESKTPKECVHIVKAVIDKKNRIFLTRTTTAHQQALLSLEGEGLTVNVNEIARCVIVHKKDVIAPLYDAKIAVFAAGTSDRPIAEEARATAEFMGCQTLSFIDIGVAGLHRLAKPLKRIIDEKVSALVVCAGMEGALPGVVASIVPIPVIGVPTSVGHGVSQGGFVALFSMLSSCSPGMAVVNIDSGFNAGAIAALIALNRSKNTNSFSQSE
jgi:NCAIR mutase (PurE)-related protein